MAILDFQNLPLQCRKMVISAKHVQRVGGVIHKEQTHVETIRLLHERRVAAFFPDGDGETVPSNVEEVACPIHALQINSMGMACADSLQFEDLVKICEEERRWEFLVMAAPLRLPGGTGSLFNPIAVF